MSTSDRDRENLELLSAELAEDSLAAALVKADLTRGERDRASTLKAVLDSRLAQLKQALGHEAQEA